MTLDAALLMLGMATAVAMLLAGISLTAWRRTGKKGLMFVGFAFSLLAIRSLLLFLAIHEISIRDALLDWRLAGLELVHL